MEEKILKYAESGLSTSIKKALEESGYVDATPIQAEAIPVLINGKDLIGQSQTGTGKTAAYALPIISKIDKENTNVQAIVLCPTRELALQVLEEIKRFSKYEKGVRSLAVYGGEPIERQIQMLKKGVSIVIGTPGRILDHIERRTLKLSNVTMAVLDEADEMLNMGFEEDIEKIFSKISEERQTILFSATMSARILGIAKKYLKDPYQIKVKAKELTVDKIEQYSIEVKQPMKEETLTRIIDVNNPEKAVIFCNTKRKVDELIERLKVKGYKAESLHGDIKQAQRERIMRKFKDGDFQVLVATDVVARGIDVDSLELVVNYDVPQEEEYYVHRIGRTGRNGNEGKAYTFVVGRERSKLQSIEKYAHTKILPGKIPTDVEMKELKNKKIIGQIENALNQQVNNEIVNSLYEELSSKMAPEEMIKALLYMKFGNEISTSKVMAPIRNNVTKMPSSGSNTRIFLNLGKLDAIKAKDIVGSITSNTVITGDEIGKISILDKYSFLEVSSDRAEELIQNMNGKKIKGREALLEFAKV